MNENAKYFKAEFDALLSKYNIKLGINIKVTYWEDDTDIELVGVSIIDGDTQREIGKIEGFEDKIIY